jgi:hypothetical protein
VCSFKTRMERPRRSTQRLRALDLESSRCYTAVRATPRSVPLPSHASRGLCCGQGIITNDCHRLTRLLRGCHQVVVEKEGLLWVMDQKVYNTVNVTHMEEMEKRKAQLVDSVPIFQWLQKSMRQQLVDAMVPQEFRAGQIIMQKGEVGDVFYILDKGEVAVSDGDVQLVTLCGASQ